LEEEKDKLAPTLDNLGEETTIADLALVSISLVRGLRKEAGSSGGRNESDRQNLGSSLRSMLEHVLSIALFPIA